jgi:phosphoribosyl isomerase A
MILLPAIDLRDGRCVRLEQGRYDAETSYSDDPFSVAQSFVDAGAEWLHVVDLDAALDGTPRNQEIIARIVGSTNIKVEVSGGIRDEQAVDAAIGSGAARIVVGTRALSDPEFVQRIVAMHGDKVAVGLDVRGTTLQARGWTESAGELHPTLDQLEAAGCKCYVVTDVTRDGMLNGPNLELLNEVAQRTSATVVASGGVGTLDDLRALKAAGVEQAIVGKALYAGRFTLAEAIQVAQ